METSEEVTTEPTSTVIAMDAPNTVPVVRDLQNELAATASAWFAKRQEKKAAMKEFTSELDALEDRMESLIFEIKSGGTQLVMHFGTEEHMEEWGAIASASGEVEKGEYVDLSDGAGGKHDPEDDDEPADEAEVIEDEQALEDEPLTFEDAV